MGCVSMSWIVSHQRLTGEESFYNKHANYSAPEDLLCCVRSYQSVSFSPRINDFTWSR